MYNDLRFTMCQLYDDAGCTRILIVGAVLVDWLEDLIFMMLHYSNNTTHVKRTWWTKWRMTSYTSVCELVSWWRYLCVYAFYFGHIAHIFGFIDLHSTNAADMPMLILAPQTTTAVILSSQCTVSCRSIYHVNNFCPIANMTNSQLLQDDERWWRPGRETCRQICICNEQLVLNYNT